MSGQNCPQGRGFSETTAALTASFASSAARFRGAAGIRIRRGYRGVRRAQAGEARGGQQDREFRTGSRAGKSDQSRSRPGRAASPSGAGSGDKKQQGRRRGEDRKACRAEAERVEGAGPAPRYRRAAGARLKHRPGPGALPVYFLEE